MDFRSQHLTAMIVLSGNSLQFNLSTPKMHVRTHKHTQTDTLLYISVNGALVEGLEFIRCIEMSVQPIGSSQGSGSPARLRHRSQFHFLFRFLRAAVCRWELNQWSLLCGKGTDSWLNARAQPGTLLLQTLGLGMRERGTRKRRRRSVIVMSQAVCKSFHAL